MKNFKKILAGIVSIATLASISAMPISATEATMETITLSPLAQEHLAASNLLLECGFTIEQINEGFAENAMEEYSPMATSSSASAVVASVSETNGTYWDDGDWTTIDTEKNTGEYYVMVATTNFANSEPKDAKPVDDNAQFDIPEYIKTTFTYPSNYTRLGSIMYADGYNSISSSSITTLATGEKQQTTVYSSDSTSVGKLSALTYIRLVTPNHTDTTENNDITYNPIKLSKSNRPLRGAQYANVSVTTKDADAPNADYSDTLRQKVIAAGDVNGDGAVNNKDSTQIAQDIVELINQTTINRVVGDTNFDGVLNDADLVQIARFIKDNKFKFWS